MNVLLKLGLSLCTLLQSAPADAALKFYVAPEDKAHEFARELVDGGQFLLYASGEIEGGDTERLSTFVTKNKITDANVFFDSPGGSLGEALKLGSFIRSKHFDTTVGAQQRGVTATCASACAYAFAGGYYRNFGEGSSPSRLGVHQFYANEGATLSAGDAQLLSGALVEYLERMGVDARAFSLATTSTPNEITWVTPAQATALRLANNGTQPTTAEIKIMQMYPYLRLEQIRQRSDIRVILTCSPKGLVAMAGIVSSPDQSANISRLTTRSYFEFDNVEAFAKGKDGAHPQNSTIWLMRDMPLSEAWHFTKARELGVWTEGGGAFRWGGYLDLSTVSSQIARYFDDCGKGR